MRALSSTTAGPRTAAAHIARRGPPPARADKMCRDVVSTPKPKSDATGEAVVAFLGAAGAREDVTCAKVRGRRNSRRRRGGRCLCLFCLVAFGAAVGRASSLELRASKCGGQTGGSVCTNFGSAPCSRLFNPTLILHPPFHPHAEHLHPGRRPRRRPGAALHVPRRHLRRVRGARGGGGGGSERRELKEKKGG